MTMTELQNYDKIMYTELDRLAQLEYAEERGEKKGLEKGLRTGLEKGREEGRNAMSEEIARNMKKSGYAVEEIARMTGLTEECVLAL